MTQEQNAVKKNLRQDLDLILSQNPVLVTGLALAPAVVGSFTAKNGLGLSLVFTMVTIPVLVLASALGYVKEKMPAFTRVICYVLLASLMLIPARALAGKIATNLFDSLGMYFSMIAVNTVWLVRAPRCEEKKPQWALWEGFCHSLGFALCLMVVSIVRELLAYGTVWGKTVGFMVVKFPAAAYVFGGFILVGCTAAALRWGVDRYHALVKFIRYKRRKWGAGK